MLSRIISTRSSAVNRAESLCGLYAIATMTSSKLATLHRMTSIWPKWMVSKLPGYIAVRVLLLFTMRVFSTHPGVGGQTFPAGRRGAGVLARLIALKSPVQGNPVIADFSNLDTFQRGRHRR